MDTKTLINALSRSLDKSGTHRMRNVHNEALGLLTTSTRGNSCLTVGVHPELPDIFIKVVTNDDPTVQFAHAIKAGVLAGTLFPKIEAIVELDNCTIILMENLEVNSDEDEQDILSFRVEMAIEAILHAEYLTESDETKKNILQMLETNFRYDIPEEQLHDLREWLISHGYKPDFHCGNYGLRKGTNQIVIFDPAYDSVHFASVERLPSEEEDEEE